MVLPFSSALTMSLPATVLTPSVAVVSTLKLKLAEEGFPAASTVDTCTVALPSSGTLAAVKFARQMPSAPTVTLRLSPPMVTVMLAPGVEVPTTSNPPDFSLKFTMLSPATEVTVIGCGTVSMAMVWFRTVRLPKASVAVMTAASS